MGCTWLKIPESPKMIELTIAMIMITGVNYAGILIHRGGGGGAPVNEEYCTPNKRNFPADLHQWSWLQFSMINHDISVFVCAEEHLCGKFFLSFSYFDAFLINLFLKSRVRPKCRVGQVMPIQHFFFFFFFFFGGGGLITLSFAMFTRSP